MPVTFTLHARSSRQKALWSLVLLLTVSTTGGTRLWRAWSQVPMQGVAWQRSLNLELSRLLQAVAENSVAAGLPLLGFSFVYGVVHALEPGYGKIVITTWFVTHPSKLKPSINLTLAASLLQGLVATALAIVVLALLQLPVRQLHLSGSWLEKGSYLLVGALGLLLCWRALKKLCLLLSRPTFIAFTPHHIHHEHCGHGYQHLLTPDQLQSGDDWRARAAIVLSMGMRPCSGTIMVLLLSKVIGVFSWGTVAALVMVAGASLTITALALLVYSFRQLMVKLGQHQVPSLWRQVGWLTLALAGGVILLVVAGVTWFAVVPTGGGIRPFQSDTGRKSESGRPCLSLAKRCSSLPLFGG